MTNFSDYIEVVNLASPGLGDSIRGPIEEFSTKHLDSFNYNEKMVGLLHGQVQSGKTAQALGIISQAADRGFRLFLFLTTDNVSLQQQTLDRAQRFLPMFQVYDETEDTNFYKNGISKPIVLVLKKNQRVLSSWFDNFSKSRFVQQCPMLIIDDEGDAASLNTKVNKNDQSKINQLIENIFRIPPSGIYLQVTATPQALLLQGISSGWKPTFAYSFNPGPAYRGGKDFYNEKTNLQRVVDDGDVNVLLSSPIVPESLRKAFLQFIVASIQLEREGKTVSNMLIHPSHKVRDHAKVKVKLHDLISSLMIDYIAKSPSLKDQFYYAWLDMQETYPSIANFDDVWGKFGKVVSTLRVFVLNSKMERNSDYNRGMNILIGGNVLGRGLTIQGLQVVYYTRQSKTPLADTVWQHQRIFGYDREIGLCRVFATRQLFKIFRDLTEASQVLFEAVSKEPIERIPIMLPENIRATRKEVIKSDDIEFIAGGVNYFPSEPSDKNTSALDSKLGVENKERIISLEEALHIVQLQEVDDDIDWDKEAFIGALKALIERKNGNDRCLLLVRTGRSITKGTGTLLSPNDRDLGEANPDKLVLTMYRLIGEREKGWNGKPLWVPNIKLPKGKVFWRITD